MTEYVYALIPLKEIWGLGLGFGVWGSFGVWALGRVPAGGGEQQDDLHMQRH